MNRKIFLCLFAIGLLLTTPFISKAVGQENKQSRLKFTTYVVEFEDSVRKSRVPLVAARIARDNGGVLRHTYQNTIKGAAIKVPEARKARLLRNRNVKRLEEDRKFKIVAPGTKPTRDSNNTSTPAQEIPWGITRIGGAADGTGKTAWVIDTGIDLNHPDLNVNPKLGFNAFSGKEGRSTDDGNGHGTHVAGTIAAVDNDLGVVGVAAGATVVPIKVLSSDGSGTTSGVIAGVDHVAANAASGDVANMSLGGGISPILDEAVINAAKQGIKFVLAAGNESDNVNNHSPARVEGTNIYTVSAMASGDRWASFSNFGNPSIDFSAPGVSIKSTWNDGGYRSISGTSMAAPHVAGILLLGNVNTDSTVVGDPDGNPDPIAHR